MKKKSWFLYLLVGLLGAIALYSGVQIFSVLRAYEAGTQTYTAIAQTAVVEKAPVVEEAPEEEVPVVGWTVDFEALEAVNPHVAGWIRDDTGAIDYPIVRGGNNIYYLYHLFDGTNNRNGTLFVDVRNSPGFIDRNTFIHGHNMQNGAMFAPLLQYAEAGYYEEHPTLELVTPDGAYVLEVFSGYLTDGSSDTFQLRFRSEETFGAYLEKIREQSDFTASVEMTASDQMVTLSTCAYDRTDARYVVHCKLTKAK